MRSSSPVPGCFSSFFFKTKPTQQPPPNSPHEPSARSQPAAAAANLTTHRQTHLSGLYDCSFPGVIPPSSLPRLEDGDLPPYSDLKSGISSHESTKILQSVMDGLSPSLRSLSLYISDHPELAFKEYLAHDHLASYLEKDKDLTVVRSWGGIDTAFMATFYSKGKDGETSGQTMGFCSEYDALPGVGHACGHNLIAVAGVGAFLAAKAAMIKLSLPGTLVLIGCPAEEGGGGKNKLIELGAFKGLDACMMCHPAPGPDHSGSIGGSLAIQVLNISFMGKTAHAAGAPWCVSCNCSRPVSLPSRQAPRLTQRLILRTRDGKNALDAAVLSYTAISNLRQQIKPAERVHGIIKSGGLAPNGEASYQIESSL